LEPSFWDMPKHAQQRMKALARLRDEVELWRDLDGRAVSVQELLDLSVAEDDDSLLDYFAQETQELRTKLKDLEFRLALSGDYDQRDAIVALHAGAGVSSRRTG